MSIGVRPQNLLIGLFPGALATIRRSARDIIIAVLIGVVVVGGAYAGAIFATGKLRDYTNTVRAHGDYIARIDSFRSPDRPPLWRLFDRFFLKQYQNPVLSAIVSVFVAISAIFAIRARDRAMLYNALIFGPFAISAWMMLDRFSVNRFSIGYAPMFAIFAADGIERVSRKSAAIESVIAIVLIGAFAIWTAPALTPVRHDVAPSVRAVEAALATVNPRNAKLFVGYSMTPFIEYLAPSFPITRVMDDRAIPLTIAPNEYLLAEVSEPQPGGTLFTRERDRLWNIARRHYFEVSLRHIERPVQFGDGWYAPEEQGMDEWRWMGRESTTILPPSTSEETVLRLNLSLPLELMPKQPVIAISLDGKTVETIHAATAEVSRDYHVRGSGAPAILRLSTDQTSHDAATGRDLGLRVRFVSWGPG